MDESFVNTGVGSSSDVPAASPFTLPPTTLHHNLRRQHDAIGELFDNVNEMTVVGKMGEEDEETAVWVYHINVIRGPIEFVAVILTVLTVLMAMNQIGLHLTYSEHKGFRVYTIRILMMIPIYSITSYCGLHNPSNAILWAMIRDMYECVVLASFLQYCLTYLGGPENLARYLMAKQLSDEAVPKTVQSPRKKSRRQFFADSDNSDTSDSDSIASPRASASSTPTHKRGTPTHKRRKKKKVTHAHHPALCWLFCPCFPVWRPRQGVFTRPWHLGAEFVRLSLLGTLQYIPFSILVTVAGVIGKMYGVYHDGRFRLDDVYLYTIIVRNWSQCWALYCLGLFYVTLHDELEEMRPVLKFSVIKLVVLFMWWQGVFVNLLEQSEGMKAADDGLLQRGWTTKEVGFCIQNFLCIVEMFFIAIGMHYAFHYTEWASEEVAALHKGTSPWTAFFHSKVVNTVKDVFHDVNSVKNTVKNTVTNTVTGGRRLPSTVRYFESGRSGSSYSEVASEDDIEEEAVKKKGRRFRTASRLLTKKERTAAKRLFTEGVNFSDIFISLREINMLERSLLEVDEASEMEGQRLVEEEAEDSEELKKATKKKKPLKEDTSEDVSEDEFEDVMGEYEVEETDVTGYSPSVSEVRRMAAHVRKAMDSSGTDSGSGTSIDLAATKGSKQWAPNAKSPTHIEQGEEGALIKVQPVSGDVLLVQSGKHDTVWKFKGRVAELIGFPQARIRLSVNGKLLNDALVLSVVVPTDAVVELALGPAKKK